MTAEEGGADVEVASDDVDKTKAGAEEERPDAGVEDEDEAEDEELSGTLIMEAEG